MTGGGLSPSFSQPSILKKREDGHSNIHAHLRSDHIGPRGLVTPGDDPRERRTFPRVTSPSHRVETREWTQNRLEVDAGNHHP